jgi:hypothetical protein
VAYPTLSKQKSIVYKHGWIRWAEEPGIKSEVRIMKHKLDMALAYLEKNVIWEEKSSILQKGLQTKVDGPLSLRRQTGEMFLSSLNREENYTPRSVHGQFIRTPLDATEHEQFQRYVLYVTSLMAKNEAEIKDDMVYVPLGESPQEEK